MFSAVDNVFHCIWLSSVIDENNYCLTRDVRAYHSARVDWVGQSRKVSTYIIDDSRSYPIISMLSEKDTWKGERFLVFDLPGCKE